MCQAAPTAVSSLNQCRNNVVPVGPCVQCIMFNIQGNILYAGESAT